MKKKILLAMMVSASALALCGSAALAEETEMMEEETESTELTCPEYEALDLVEMGDCTDLTVTITPITVTEEAVVSQALSNMESAGVYEEYTEGEVAEGDIANIDYVGKLDGEAFDGGTAEGYDLEIGSDSFIDGFEDGLIGVAVGDTVDLTLTFPESYSNEDLAGQETVFTVTVNAIKKVPSEVTDELAAQMDDGAYDSAEAYLASVEESLEHVYQLYNEYQANEALFSQIKDSSEFLGFGEELEAYLEEKAAESKENMKASAEAYGYEYEDLLESYYGMTEEEYDEYLMENLESTLENEIYIKAICETLGLDTELTEEQYADGCADLALLYLSVDADYAQAYLEYYLGEETVRSMVLEDLVLDQVRAESTVEEAAAEEETE